MGAVLGEGSEWKVGYVYTLITFASATTSYVRAQHALVCYCDLMSL